MGCSWPWTHSWTQSGARPPRAEIVDGLLLDAWQTTATSPTGPTSDAFIDHVDHALSESETGTTLRRLLAAQGPGPSGPNTDKRDTVVTQEIETSRQQWRPADNGTVDVLPHLCWSQPLTANSDGQ